MEHEELTGQIIGCAITVHRELGPGFLESIYEKALAVEFARNGMRFHAQSSVPVHYRGEIIGEHRLDLLVEDQVVVELKAIKTLEDVHFAQVRSYLKACGLKHGLLFNFSTVPLTIRRVIHSP